MNIKALSISCSDMKQLKYVNRYEVFFERYLLLHHCIYKYGWEHEEVVYCADEYCNVHARQMLRPCVNYENNVSLILGPKDFRIEHLSFELLLGEVYSLQIVFFNRKRNEIFGRYSLINYIEITNCSKGTGRLNFENEGLKSPLHWFSLPSSCELILLLKGAIKITSDIDYSIQMEELND